MKLRSWIALAFACLALLSPMVLRTLGLTSYDSERSADDPYRPADRGVAERVCLVSEWMVPGCAIIWIISQIRQRYAVLFPEEEYGGLVFPIIAGSSGLALLIRKWATWGPFTQQHFAAGQGWEFGVGWLLIWWCIVFVRFNRTPLSRPPVIDGGLIK